MSYQDFQTRANEADAQIAKLEKRLEELMAKQDGSGGQKKKKRVMEQKYPKIDESKLPFNTIKDEAIVIREKGSEAQMTVTLCNGEANPPFISAKGINHLKNNFEAGPLDIYVDTYAKCGTTLTIHMVYQILRHGGQTIAGASAKDMSDPWNAVPWPEVQVSQQLYNESKADKFYEFVSEANKKNEYRIYKTHAPFINMPCKDGFLKSGSKIIHCTRNPKDVICSYFNFFCKEPFVKYRGDFDTMVEWFCDGTVVHSSFFDFELAWWRAYQDNPGSILWISFEDIVTNPLREIQKVAQFLNVDLSSDQVNKIAEEISFKKMKAAASKSKSAIAKTLVNKGTIGRWKGKLSEAQSARIDRIVNARFRGTGIEFNFGDE